MKPDWKDAPEWAQWLAMDEGGEWFWYEYAPSWDANYGVWLNQLKLGRHTFAGPTPDCASVESLEHRPLVSLMAGADTWATTTNPDARPGSEGQGA